MSFLNITYMKKKYSQLAIGRYKRIYIQSAVKTYEIANSMKNNVIMIPMLSLIKPKIHKIISNEPIFIPLSSYNFEAGGSLQ